MILTTGRGRTGSAVGNAGDRRRHHDEPHVAHRDRARQHELYARIPGHVVQAGIRAAGRGI